MKLSVVIPVCNGGQDLVQCLQALAASTRRADEIIVVDDASTDASAETARSFGAQVVQIVDGPVGPAAARNTGAYVAQGDVLLFIDADVAVHSDTLHLVVTHLSECADVAALFGSYDDAPPKPGLISRYKNLQHHYTHQNGQREASTFWAGCGAVRRSAFLAVGGYDGCYARPSIEDIELGIRLRRTGYRVWLCPDVQVAHLKRWTVASWLRADIRDRAIPWTRLILSGAKLPADLGLDLKNQFSALVAWQLISSLVLGFWLPWCWVLVPLLLAVLIMLNAPLYRLFVRRGGIAFAAKAIGLHMTYYMYSSVIFGNLFVWHVLQKFAEALSTLIKVKLTPKDAEHD